MPENPYLPLAISLGVGLLVGLQREWIASGVAGIRTFALLSLFGTVVTLLPQPMDAIGFGVGLLAVTALLWISNRAKLDRSEAGPGITTEVAALLVFCLGAVIGAGYTEPAIVVAGVVAVLLHWKAPLHQFVTGLDAAEFRVIIRLVLIALVILPILPNQVYGPYEVLNPFQIWLMVVLIVSISVGAYVAYRLLGVRTGSLLGGLLGGLISSTAATLSYARMARRQPEFGSTAALVIMLATAVVNLRLLVQIAAVNASFLQIAGPPILILLAVMTILSLAMLAFVRPVPIDDELHKNPAQLRTALVVGGLYAIILLAAAATKEHFGEEGMYWVAGVSGLVDLNAITLSAAQLVSDEQIVPAVAWRMIVIATIANLAFKLFIVAIWGSRLTAWILAILFGISAAAAGALLLYWQASWLTGN